MNDEVKADFAELEEVAADAGAVIVATSAAPSATTSSIARSVS
jgi:hypothetical protein